MASAVLCYRDRSDSNPIGHTSRKYGAEREVPQMRLDLPSPAFTHDEGEIPARIAKAKRVACKSRYSTRSGNRIKHKNESKDLQGLVSLGREQGYLTFDQVNDSLLSFLCFIRF